LLIKNKAEVVEEHPSLMIETETFISAVPTQIRLLYPIPRRANGPAQLTNTNLFARDGWTCQYCGRHKVELKKTETLSRDHIHPQDKGGLMFG
jgi:5-methylcytosine-specific restriction endonuclease McrA